MKEMIQERKAVNKICWIQYAGAAVVIGIYLYLWSQKGILWKYSKEKFTIMPKRTTISTVFLILGLYGCLFRRRSSEKTEQIRTVVTFLMTPVVVLFFVEFANIAGPNLLWRECSLYYIYKTGWNLIWLWLLLFLLYCVTNSMRMSGCLLSILMAGFSLVCYYVNKFRRVPLLASDLTDVGTAMTVMENYNYALRFHDVIMLLGIAVWCICLLRTVKVKPFTGKKRLWAVSGFAASFAVFTWIWVYTPVTQIIHLQINTFLPKKGYWKNGTLLNFMISFHYLVVEKPKGYSVEAAEELAKPYREEAQLQTEDAVPNVIAIMDEAFADLQGIWSFETSEEIMPFFHSLKEDTVKGYLYVPYFGAQTANTEFEFLTGLTKAFLPAGSTPYQLYINDDLPGLNTALRKEQYQGILALHPYYENGYNRADAYQKIGFRDFISIEDMEYEDSDLVRKFVSDDKNADLIIEEYEAAKTESDAPFYLFNVTMQNHSGYELKYDNFEEPITIESDHYDEEARQYVNLIRKTDESLEKLVNYFREVEEPTILVFFGDHQPSLPDSFYESIMGESLSDLSGKDLLKRYQTPFLIWANYDIEEQEGIETSPNYLSMLMKKAAGMKMTPFECYLEDLYEEIPVLSVNGMVDKEGTYYQISKKNPYKEKLLEYQILQYNTLFDTEHRIRDFFD